MATRIGRMASWLVVVGLAAGCGADDETGGTSSSSSGGGTGGTTSSGGGGGAGGVAEGGAGGGPTCTPGETVSCYEGPAGTEGIGICTAGSGTCLPDGSGVDECEGQQLPTTDICSTEDDEDCDGATPGCSGTALWEALITSTTSTSQSVNSVAVGATGVYVAGRIEGLADFAGSALDGGSASGSWVAKVDFTGSPVWTQVITSSHVAGVSGIAVDDQERVTVVGSFQSDIDAGDGVHQGQGNWDVFVASYEGNDGSFRYLNRFASSSWQVGRGIAARPDGRVAITGDFYGAINFGGNQLSSTGGGTALDLFVAVFDAAGAHLWSKRFGDALYQAGQKVAFGPDGHLVVGGYNNGTIDFGGTPHTTAGLTDIVVAKLDGTTGARIWSALYGDANGQDGTNGVAVGPDGSVLLATYSPSVTAGTVDFGLGGVVGYFFVVKHDSAGNVLWSKGYGGLRGVSQVAVDFAGDVVLAGSIQGTIDFGAGPVSSYGSSHDAFVVKLAGGDGSELWTHLFGDTNQQDQLQRAFALATDSAGTIYAGGSWHGAADFGFGERVSGAGLGGSDGWLLQLSP